MIKSEGVSVHQSISIQHHLHHHHVHQSVLVPDGAKVDGAGAALAQMAPSKKSGTRRQEKPPYSYIALIVMAIQ
ncbi:hypothetical protein GE061_005876, partial [Apolygus lucorum]